MSIFSLFSARSAPTDVADEKAPKRVFNLAVQIYHFTGWIPALRYAFRGDLARYYQYLGGILLATAGTKTIDKVFSDDVERYGEDTPRGALSALWLRRYRESGGDLTSTFAGTVPDDDLAIIRAGSISGHDGLIVALKDLASISLLMNKAKFIFKTTATTAGIVFAILVAMLLAIPWMTAPKLKEAMAIPESAYGDLTRNFFDFAATVDMLAAPALLLGITALIAAIWSFSNFTGPLRKRLDNVFLWQLYRHFQGIRLIGTLATLLKQQASNEARVHNALELIKAHSNPWVASHVGQMISEIEDGVPVITAMDTGLLNRAVYFDLYDMTLAKGLEDGLQDTKEKLESEVLGEVSAKASKFRWVVSLGAVFSLFGIYIFHIVVVRDMTNSVTQAF